LSARYSNSPSLSLVIARSRIYSLLHGVLCLLTMIALYRVAARGYPVLLLLLLPAATLCCWQTAQQPLAGALLSWKRGGLFICEGAETTPVTLQRNSICLPWVIYLAWVGPAGSVRRSVKLFPDSVPSCDLRRLRVRLNLQR
jgi:hypothetical protein